MGYTIKFLTYPLSGGGSVELDSVSSYSAQDVGSKIDRVQFVNSNASYYHDRGYSPAYRDISVRGQDILSVCNQLKAIYEAGASVSFIDIYGYTHSNTRLLNFSYEFNRSKGSYNYSFDLLVIHNTDYIFKVGGAVQYGIESCDIDEKSVEVETTFTPSGLKIVKKEYQASVFEIRYNGIEILSGGQGAFTTLALSGAGIIPLDTPDGRSFQALVTSKSTSLMAGVENFQRFSVSFIAGLSESIFADPDTDALIDSYTVRDNSARVSVHRTIGGIVVQKFPRVQHLELSFTCHISKDLAHSGYVTGETISVTLDQAYSGTVMDKEISSVEGSNSIVRLSISMVVV